MPRKSAADYYRIHKQLRRFWLTHNSLYAELTSQEQWTLHDYFQPSKDLSKEQLLQHRAGITKRRPGLPQQAGRSYAKFQSTAAAWAVQAVRAKHAVKVPAGRRKRGDYHITVKAVVRPEPDLHRLARALLAMARQQALPPEDGASSPDGPSGRRVPRRAK